MDCKHSRRRFLQMSGATLFAAASTPLLARALHASNETGGTAMGDSTKLDAISPAAAALYERACVLDCNTLASIGYELRDAASLEALRESGLTALKSTLGGDDGTFEDAVADIAAAQTLIERHPELLVKVKRHADLVRAKPESRVAVIFSFEAASMLDGKLERIDLFRQLDVLVMQLTYNHATPFGCGCLDGDTGGVTALGREAIARMNALGVALDLSHANVRTTADGIALSDKPPLITHAGCRAIFDHPRNKRDRDMRAMAEKGGVMGIYMLPFLTPDDRQPTLADYMRHMVHALDICGEDHVGIGTDSLFFTATAKDLQAIKQDEQDRRERGVGAPGENRPPYLPDVNTPRKLEFVAAALLKHGYSARVTDKVLGLNFSRAFKEIWVA
jgi:membrane dipeptidase